MNTRLGKSVQFTIAPYPLTYCGISITFSKAIKVDFESTWNAMVNAKHHRNVDFPARQLAKILTDHVQDDWEGNSESHSHGPAILASKSVGSMHLLGEVMVYEIGE